MLRRVFLYAVLGFAFYNGALYFGPVRRQFYVSQGNYQANIIKAQEFLERRQPCDVVLVGSSMGSMLPEEALGSNALNLAFSNGSLLTGLQLAADHPSPPKVVVIEINWLTRDVDSDILGNAEMPVVSSLRRWLPALHEKYKPSNFLAGRVVRWGLRGGQVAVERVENLVHPKNAPAPPVSETPTSGNTDFGAYMLQILIDDYSEPADPALLDTRLAQAAERIARLESRGVRCVFLLMPVHPAASNSPWLVSLRSAAEKRFPPSRYAWILPPEGKVFHPNDGLHLAGEEADEFARYVRAQVDALTAEAR